MKERLLDLMKQAAEQEKMFYIKVRMPGAPSAETIINPPENMRMKMNYYNTCYANDLSMYKVPSIRIVEFGFLETNMI